MGLSFTRKTSMSVFFFAAILLSIYPFKASADWPEKKLITLVAPFPAGGSADILARIVAHKLTGALGTSVIVENRPGASGMTGSCVVAKAKPDGYTLLLGSIANALNNFLFKNPACEVKDLDPVSQIVSVPNYISSSPNLPVNSFPELIKYIKQNPGKVSFATPGVGNSPFMSIELLKLMAGIDILIAPYPGSPQAIQDVIAGRVDVAVDNTSLPYILNKQLKGLAVTTLQRSPFVDLPAVAETIPGYDVTSWYGVFAPAGTPSGIVEKLGAEIQKVMQSEDVRKQVATIGAVPVGSLPREFKPFVDGEVSKWGKIVAEAKLEKR